MDQMGRRRTKDLDLPPRMHKKGNAYYHVSRGDRTWTPLGTDINRARIKWAVLEDTGTSDRFVDVLDRWTLTRDYLELSDGSKKTYASVIGQLREYFADFWLRDFEPFHVAQWLDNHRSKGQANTGKSILSKVFEFAIRNGLSKQNPTKDLSRNKVEGRDRYLTASEFKEIWNKGDPLVRIAMDIGYMTSARIIDILKAEKADMQEDGFYIKAKKNKAKILFEWTPELRSVLEEALALHPPGSRCQTILCNSRGKPVPYNTFNDWWLAAVRMAGVEDAQFRDIRAQSATDAEHQGKDHQKLLGHSTRAMSDKYVKVRRPVTIQPMRRVV